VSVENLPIGTNTISFSRAKSARGIEYGIDAKDGGWNFVLRIAEVPGARYYLNGRLIAFATAGIRMSGRRNQLLVVTTGGHTGIR
jgi:hypothetical protein